MIDETARAFIVTTGLEFDPAAHRYTLDGRVVPSVTQLLEAAGLVDLDGIDPGVLRRKRELGTWVHAAIALMLDDDLDVETVWPPAAPYLAAFDRFRVESRFVFVRELCEQPLVDPVLGFAGTPDLVGRFPEGGATAVLDVKCTYTLAPTCGLQTAAYQHLLRVGANCPVTKRLALWLRPDGTYSAKDYSSDARHRDDWPAFRAVLALWHWRRNHDC